MTFKYHIDMAKEWEDARTSNFKYHEGRIGAAWNDAEKAHLLGGYWQEGLSVVRLAARHRRREAGIVAQLNRLAQNPTETARLQLLLPKEKPVANPINEFLASLKQRGFDAVEVCSDPNCKECARVRAYLGVDVASGQSATDEKDASLDKRPNADVIHAFADNKTVQRLNSSKQWVDYTFDQFRKINVGDPKWQWRIRPATVEIPVFVSNPKGKQVSFSQITAPNLALTFFDGKLVGARVL